MGDRQHNSPQHVLELIDEPKKEFLGYWSLFLKSSSDWTVISLEILSYLHLAPYSPRDGLLQVNQSKSKIEPELMYDPMKLQPKKDGAQVSGNYHNQPSSATGCTYSRSSKRLPRDFQCLTFWTHQVHLSTKIKSKSENKWLKPVRPFACTYIV